MKLEETENKLKDHSVKGHSVKVIQNGNGNIPKTKMTPLHLRQTAASSSKMAARPQKGSIPSPVGVARPNPKKLTRQLAFSRSEPDGAVADNNNGSSSLTAGCCTQKTMTSGSASLQKAKSNREVLAQAEKFAEMKNKRQSSSVTQRKGDNEQRKQIPQEKQKLELKTLSLSKKKSELIGSSPNSIKEAKMGNINMPLKLRPQGNLKCCSKLEPVEFVVPLEPHIEVVEGSELELWVKTKGASKVIWVKNDQLVAHAPPDIVYKDNSSDGIYSLRIKDVFVQDSGLWIAEAYGPQGSESISWCRVQVVEDEAEDESIILDCPPVVPRRQLIVPKIIEPSSTIMEEHEQFEDKEPIISSPPPSATERRSFFSTSQSHSSHEYDDALEDIHELPEEEQEEADHTQEEQIRTNLLSQSSSESFDLSVADVDNAPRFLLGPSNLIVLLGECVNLRLKFSAPEPSKVDVCWTKLSRGTFGPLRDLSLISQPTVDLLLLRIPSASYEDSGKYRVRISNEYGTDVHSCLIAVEGPPEPPACAPTSLVDDGQVIISWGPCPFDGGSVIMGYRLEMKIEPKSSDCGCPHLKNWVPLTEPGFKGLCHVLKDPKGCHSHYFRVAVENSHGLGRYSEISEGFSVAKDVTEEKLSYEYKDVKLKHKEFLEDYDKHEQLGKGRFGVVFKVTNKEVGRTYAGKFVKCRKSSDKERAELEYKIMNDLGYHPKLICLVDAYEMSREFVIVTELILGGELFERVVADDFTLTERDAVSFLRQICQGVSYIHERAIMHLDLKPENILCTQRAVSGNSSHIKIIDFGLAQYYNPEIPLQVLFGTAEFVSPEIINYETICPATDMWSVGVVTYILLSGLSPFLGDDDNETFSNITAGELDFDDDAFESVSGDAKDFISSLIVKRKEKRLTAAECLSHKWLALSDAEKKDNVLSTDKLKRFLLRRKWQKTGNAIRALGRITTLYSLASRRSSGSSSVARTHASSSSVEDDVFGVGDTTTRKRESYDENYCRSDSGIGGENLSGNFSID